MKRALPFMPFIAVLLLPAPSHADPCRDPDGHLRLPIALDLGSADFASAPSACASKRMALDLRASAIIDKPDFYGVLGATAVLSGSLLVHERVWITASANLYRFDFAQNASLVATQHGFGPVAFGAHASLISGERFALSPFVRVLSPPETGYQHAFRTGLEYGFSGLLVLAPRFSLAGTLSAPFVGTFVGTRAHWQYTPRVSVDGIYAPFSWLDVLAGMELRLGNDPDGRLELLAPRSGLRFQLGRGVELHLEAMFPLQGLGGLERTDALFALGGSVTW